MAGNRNYSIDLLKIIASIFVIAVHHIQNIGFTTLALNTKTAAVSTYVFQIMLVCVPLFFISSGYLLSKREVDVNHYTKLIPFLIRIAGLLILANIFGVNSKIEGFSYFK